MSAIMQFRIKPSVYVFPWKPILSAFRINILNLRSPEGCPINKHHFLCWGFGKNQTSCYVCITITKKEL